MIKRLCTIVMISFSLSGCISNHYHESGVALNNVLLSQIHNGETTSWELEELLGIPDEKFLTDDDGKKQLLSNSREPIIRDDFPSVANSDNKPSIKVSSEQSRKDNKSKNQKMEWKYYYRFSKLSKRIFYSNLKSYSFAVTVNLVNNIVVGYDIEQSTNQ